MDKTLLLSLRSSSSCARIEGVIRERTISDLFSRFIKKLPRLGTSAGAKPQATRGGGGKASLWIGRRLYFSTSHGRLYALSACPDTSGGMRPSTIDPRATGRADRYELRTCLRQDRVSTRHRSLEKLCPPAVPNRPPRSCFQASGGGWDVRGQTEDLQLRWKHDELLLGSCDARHDAQTGSPSACPWSSSGFGTAARRECPSLSTDGLSALPGPEP